MMPGGLDKNEELLKIITIYDKLEKQNKNM
jgi:hypothetical protein